MSAAPALLAAALFGAAAPLGKYLLGGTEALPLAALFYLGSGFGLALWFLIRRLVSGASPPRAPLRAGDWANLGGAVLFGGVLAPFLFLVGLSFAPASTVSLLLNLELVFTALLAWLFFREGFELRVAFGLAVLVGGCLMLAWPKSGMEGLGMGALAVVGACLCWGLDNNLTQRLADRDPIQVAAVKGLAGGTVNGAIALLMGMRFLSGASLGTALVVGFMGYGLSLVLFVLSLGRIGTARTTGIFAAGPFVGAALSAILLREPLTLTFFLATLAVILGLILALGGRHAHPHSHYGLSHDHRHLHDDHHRHDHGPDLPPGEPHTHEHVHDPLEHVHPHYPDTHHRHGH